MVKSPATWEILIRWWGITKWDVALCLKKPKRNNLFALRASASSAVHIYFVFGPVECGNAGERGSTVLLALRV
jgi:hypothetical protein